MIRAAFVAVTLAACAFTGHAFAASGREVVNMDGGPGDRLVIVRDGSAGDGAWWSGGQDVLDYTDASGDRVRVYADHPVSRTEAEDRLAEAAHDAGRAQAGGRRAARAARRTAPEAQRSAG